MIIEAHTHSKAFKRGTTKQIAEKLGVEDCLSKMVGRLTLNSEKPSDFLLLREIYKVLKGEEYGGGGRIDLTDSKGKLQLSWSNVDSVAPLKIKKEKEK